MQTISTYDAKMAQLERASQQALKGERLNRLVTAVVMEARGVYGAPDVAKAKPFAAGILTNLDAIDKLLQEWSPMVNPEDRKLFDAVVVMAREFRGFRAETARLGTEVSPDAADQQGNNEANRANRRQFQVEIDRLTAANQADLTEIRAEVTALADTRMTLMVSIAGLGLLVACIAAFWIGFRGIAVPLRNVAGALGRLAGGDLSVSTPSSVSRDEVGDLWNTVGAFRDALETAERARRDETANREANQAARRQEMQALMARFEAEIGGIVIRVGEAANRVLSAAETLSVSANASSERSTSVASISEETSANIQSVAGASEELSASIGEIGRSISEASRLIGETVGQAREAETDVRALAESASKVGDIVAMIQAIAEQTNLLALNATIESARAGEAGRGFAVVANEVKALAGQTAKATHDIEAQMSVIQSATQRTVDKISDVAHRIQTLDRISSSVAAAAEQQNAATGEITRNIQEAAAAATQMTGDISEVRSAAQVSGDASRGLVQEARSLSDQSDTLKANVRAFLDGIKVA